MPRARLGLGETRRPGLHPRTAKRLPELLQLREKQEYGKGGGMEPWGRQGGRWEPGQDGQRALSC